LVDKEGVFLYPFFLDFGCRILPSKYFLNKLGRVVPLLRRACPDTSGGKLGGGFERKI
jgi:hypothetical protein